MEDIILISDDSEDEMECPGWLSDFVVEFWERDMCPPPQPEPPATDLEKAPAAADEIIDISSDEEADDVVVISDDEDPPMMAVGPTPRPPPQSEECECDSSMFFTDEDE